MLLLKCCALNYLTSIKHSHKYHVIYDIDTFGQLPFIYLLFNCEQAQKITINVK